MSNPQRKTRRRFLADMLFLGGGLSAAALLSGSDLGCSGGQETPPGIAGDVMMAPPPQPPSPTPQPQAGGDPPLVMGRMVIPEPKQNCD